MWGNDIEAPRLIALRKAALEGLGSDRPFAQNIRLTLRVQIARPKGGENVGDLDTFIAGVCDGLMAGDPRARIHALFNEQKNADVHPRETIAIRDDQHVVQINAEKKVGSGSHRGYEVVLAGE